MNFFIDPCAGCDFFAEDVMWPECCLSIIIERFCEMKELNSLDFEKNYLLLYREVCIVRKG